MEFCAGLMLKGMKSVKEFRGFSRWRRVLGEREELDSGREGGKGREKEGLEGYEATRLY